ncbi:adenylate/guanylate cyclase domain-containing protein [Desulfohalobium retbaense]|uniref:Adenylate/guanylate cyclase with integral membrane sensor n=1 Tax=Desulfohalobium retbaense (strain ATCC 49708 / DSM 5692 / JCM 16813 / HR100) TaxID=485915 RepID=C8X0L6_DESRD|nr:adenylate/guanylate cyclase domain-containing protein [Desulfohalobium retbaense]ACV67963.1 adenylate/guanylate cyclase with integral membrane sensor [Desulfohalobium retbaense DSM 5692]
MSMRIKVFVGIFCIAFLASGATGSYFYLQAKMALYQGIRQQLEASAASTAALIDGEALQQLRSPDDAGSPAHRTIQEVLHSVAQATPEYLYVYTMRLDDGGVEFVVDTPPSDDNGDGTISEEEMPAPIGTPYESAPQSLRRGFTQVSSDSEPYVDQWGRTMSGYAPVYNSQGDSVGLLGIDMDVSRIHRKLSLIVQGGLISLGMAVALAIVLAYYFARQTLVPVRRLQNAMTRVQEGDYAVHMDTDRKDEFGQLANHFNTMVTQLRQKAWLVNNMGKVVNKNVVQRIQDESLELGGEVLQTTVLFCDLRGFTALSEKLPPKLLVHLLNEYFSAMVEAVERHGGIVDKFIGDAVMAVFGHPTPLPQEQDAALAAAQDMLAACDSLNVTMGVHKDILLINSVGIHTGMVMAGNIGSPERMEFTVMGDAVNVAARLENLTRQLGTRLAVSGDVVATLQDGSPLVSAGECDVSGRKEPVQVAILSQVESSSLERSPIRTDSQGD